MSTAAGLITADRFFELTVEGDRKHLVDGVIVMNEPRLSHGVLQAAISSALYSWCRSGEGRGIASLPADVVVDELNVYGPDVLWIAERHLPGDRDARLARIPDLCVEIRSPSTWRYDIGAKKRAYEAGGLPELWLVDDVAETVLVFRRSAPDRDHFDLALELGRGEALSSPQLPGFELKLDELFRR